MGLKEALESILQFGKPQHGSSDGPTSLVLMLKQPRFPTLEQLRVAGEHAFGTEFSTGKGGRHCVYQQVLFTLMNVGAHTLSFLFYTQPYGGPESAKAMRRLDQRKAWEEHTAWIAVDYAKGDVDLDSKYVVLAMLCTELYDSNCLGLYIPGERVFVPGEEFARRQLARIISSRSVKVT
jgi:hypothetical protein